MKHLINSLAPKPPKFDTLVHFGAGPFFDADLYASLPARRYILVEADPDSAAELQRSADPARFQVLEKLVAPAPGPQQFRRFSLPSLNGLFGLGGMKSIYPRAREIGQLSMPAVTPSRLLAGIALAGDAEHALVLDLPGLETDLLADLTGAAPLRFDWIFVSGAGSPLMEKAKALQEAMQIAKKHHFRTLAENAKSNPLQPVTVFQRDRRALELQTLSQEREELKVELEKSQHEIAAARDNLAKERDQAKAERDTTRKERDTAINEREAFKAKAAELEKTRQEIAAARDNLAKERDQLKKLAGDRAARIAELEAQVADQAERQKQIDEEMAKAEGQLEMLKELLRPALT